MARVPKRWQGMHADRLKDAKRNPLEVRFAKAWHQLNTECDTDKPGRPSVLDYMVANNAGFIPAASERDREVASTVIQWLGTEVGSRWLKSVVSGLTDDDLEFLESHEHAEAKDRKRMRDIVKKLRGEA